MNEELKFLESMNRIAELGRKQDGNLTREDVARELDMTLNETQWDVMGEFLFHRNVFLEGYTPKESDQPKPEYKFSQDEVNFMHFYEDDLKNIPRKTEAELEAMLKKGEDVYELLLPWIYEMCKDFADGTEPLGDLVQEANLKAFTYINSATVAKDGVPLQSLKQDIMKALKAFVCKNNEADKESSKIVNKLNQLIEATEVLRKQNASYTVEDISTFLDIPIDEIERLLKIAGE